MVLLVYSAFGWAEALMKTVREEIRPDESWLNHRERGAIGLIRLTAFWVELIGRRPMRLLLRLIAAYYVVFDRTARRASRNWLERVHGRPVKLRIYTGYT